MQAINFTSQINWKAYGQKALPYCTKAAKATTVALAIFALKGLSPFVTFAALFPTLTSLGGAELSKRVQARDWEGAGSCLRICRLAAATLYAGMGVYSVEKFLENRSLAQLLFGIYRLGTALPLFNLPDKARLASSAKSYFEGDHISFATDIAEWFSCIVYRSQKALIGTPPKLAIGALATATLVEQLKVQIKEISRLLTVINLDAAAEIENAVEESREMSYLLLHVRYVIAEIAQLPQDQQMPWIEQLLDLFAGRTLPRRIRNEFEGEFSENFASLLSAKNGSLLDPQTRMDLSKSLEDLGRKPTLDREELQRIDRALKEIGHQALRCECYAPSKNLEEIRGQIQKDIQRIAKLFHSESLKKGENTRKNYMETPLFDYWYETWGFQGRRAQDLTLKLCAFFGVAEADLVQKMEQSDISTLQKLVDKKIIDAEDLAKPTLFLEKLDAYLKTHTVRRRSYRALLASSYSFAQNLIFRNGGYVKRHCERFLRLRIVRPIFLGIRLPFMIYAHLTFPHRNPAVQASPLTHRIAAEIHYLIGRTFATYPLLLTELVGIHVPYVKTASIAFAFSLSFCTE